jgi:hypothetical protein
VFPGVWTSIDGLIGEDRFLAPFEVRRELHVQDDELYQWARQHGAVFVDPDGQQQAMVGEMVDRYRAWINRATDRPFADPFVIALARALVTVGRECSVVSHEIPGGPGAAKIPNVCAEYSIPHLRLVDMFEREGWTF